MRSVKDVNKFARLPFNMPGAFLTAGTQVPQKTREDWSTQAKILIHRIVDDPISMLVVSLSAKSVGRPGHDESQFRIAETN